MFVLPPVSLNKWRWLWMINKAAIFKLSHHLAINFLLAAFRMFWIEWARKQRKEDYLRRWFLAQDCLLGLFVDCDIVTHYNETIVSITRWDQKERTGKWIFPVMAFRTTWPNQKEFVKGLFHCPIGERLSLCYRNKTQWVCVWLHFGTRLWRLIFDFIVC